MVDWDKDLFMTFNGIEYVVEVLGIVMDNGKKIRIVNGIDPKGKHDLVFRVDEDGKALYQDTVVKNPPQEWWTNVYRQHNKGCGTATVFTAGLFHSEEKAKKGLVNVTETCFSWVKSILLHSE